MVTLEEKLETWMSLSKGLKILKAQEMELRKELVSIIVPSGQVGVHSKPIGILDVKVTLRNNYKMDQAAVEINLDSMTQAERNAIKFTASVIMTEYKTIPEDNRELLDMCIEVVPAAPTLAVDFQKDTSNVE